MLCDHTVLVDGFAFDFVELLYELGLVWAFEVQREAVDGFDFGELGDCVF